jgi:hypothetical protein
VHVGERAIQELCIKEGLCLLEVQKKFVLSRARTGTTSCSTILYWFQGSETGTQAVAVPCQDNILLTTPSSVTVTTQAEETEDISHSAGPNDKTCPCQLTTHTNDTPAVDCGPFHSSRLKEFILKNNWCMIAFPCILTILKFYHSSFIAT